MLKSRKINKYIRQVCNLIKKMTKNNFQNNLILKDEIKKKLNKNKKMRLLKGEIERKKN
jgi:hypothetical protein